MMTENSLLSFWIPTYNRAEILKEGLIDLIKKIKRHNISIHVIDNCSTDDTESVVREMQQSYSFLYFYKNETNIGGDLNILKCYQLAKTNYIDVIGDSYRISENSIEEILDILYNKKPNLLVINSSRVKSLESRSYNNTISFLSDLGFHLDLTGVLITSREAVKEKYYKRHLATNFIHYGMNIEYLMDLDNPLIYWYASSTIKMTKLQKISTSWWHKKVEIFAKNWTVFIFSLPSQIPIDVKEKIILEHSKKGRNFEFQDIVKDKINNTLNYDSYYAHKKYIPFVTNTSLAYIKFISILPHSLFKFILFTYKYTQKK